MIFILSNDFVILITVFEKINQWSVLTSVNLLLINRWTNAVFPTFESPIRTTLQSCLASESLCRTLPILLFDFFGENLQLNLFHLFKKTGFVYFLITLHNICPFTKNKWQKKWHLITWRNRVRLTFNILYNIINKIKTE